MENKNLLNFKELETLIVSIFPHVKAEIIGAKLKNKIVIIPRNKADAIFILDEATNTYVESETDIKIKLESEVTKLTQKSFEKLPPLEAENLIYKFPKAYRSIFSNNSIGTYYSQLIVILTEQIIFNVNIGEMHFKNGYMDLKDLKFKKREVGKHYITKYIERDYKPSTQANQAEIRKVFKQIYPDDADFNCVSMMLGASLTGKSTINQDLLFLLGKGSAGKSFIMMVTSASIECYLKELNSNTLTLNNAKADKILNTFISNPQVRITWINEPEETKMDSSLFKNLADGSLTTTELYKDGSKSFKVYFKVIFTSNTLPNITLDTGTARRIISLDHPSTFVDNINEVNESKHIYLKDKNLLDKIKAKDELLNAWFDIMAVQANKWLNGAQIPYTKNFNESKDTILLSNDWAKDFIDENLIITDNTEDRISKNAMYDRFREKFPNKRLSPLQLISTLKDKKLLYSAQARSDKVQGCYMCVKFQDDWLEPEDNGLDFGTNTKPLNKKITIDDILENDKDKQIEDLKAQLKKLQEDQQALINKAVAEALAIANKADNVVENVKASDTITIKPNKSNTPFGKSKKVVDAEALDAELIAEMF